MALQLGSRSVSAVARIVTGNGTGLGDKLPPVAPYRSLPAIMEFFREYGCNDTYSWGGGQPSRVPYTESRLKEYVATGQIPKIIEDALDPSHFEGSDHTPDRAAEYLNKTLHRDGYELRLVSKRWRLCRLGDNIVSAPTKTAHVVVDPTSRAFVEEQVAKCRAKLDGGDFDGAITNARTLIEAVLYGIEERLTGVKGEHADLSDLFRRVQKPLNLDPSNPKLSNTLRQVLTGFVSIVSGLAALRNSMSDAHGGRVKPERHHAVLAINGALTFADFLCETYAYQAAKGTLKPITSSAKP